MMPAVICRKESMIEATMKGYATATDLADYLVKKGLPFRDAHEVVGKAVGLGIQKGLDLSKLTLTQLQEFSELITDDVFDILTLEGSLNARDHHGGTAPIQVLKAVAAAREKISRP
jgi:argininosuccinate lyase